MKKDHTLHAPLFGAVFMMAVCLSASAQAPTISSVTANNSPGFTGYAGSVMTITGTNLDSAASVTFGGRNAFILTDSSTQITCVLDTGASGFVTVTTAAGYATDTTFFFYFGYITNADGDWNTAGTWLNGYVPPPSAATTIANAVTINGSSQPNPSSVRVNLGASLTFGASGALTASEVFNYGTLAWTGAGLLDLAASGSLTNSGTFTAGAGKVKFENAGTISGSSAIVFNNLTINAGMITLTTVPTINDSLVINGNSANVSAAPGYGGNSYLVYNASTRQTGGEWKPNASSGPGVPQNVTIGSYSTDTISTTGYFQLNGNLTIGDEAIFTQRSTMLFQSLRFAGNFIDTSGGTYTDNGSLTQFVGTANATIASGSVISRLKLSNPSGTFLQLGSTLALGGNIGALHFSSGGGLDLEGNILDISSGGGIVPFATGAKTIQSTGYQGLLFLIGANTIGGANGRGTLTTASNVLVVVGGSLTLETASVLTVNGSLGMDNGGYISTAIAPVYGSGSTLIYNSGNLYTVGNEWTAGVTSGPGVPYNVSIGALRRGSGLSLDNSTRTMTGSLTFSDSAGTLSMGSGTLNIAGNWVNNTSNVANFTPGSSTVVFDGAVAQTIGGSNTNIDGYDFYNLTFANTPGGFTLGQRVLVSNIMTMTGGVVNTGSNTLFVINSAPAAITGYGTQSYVNGYLQRDVASSGSYDFPLGTAGNPLGAAGNYELANITNSGLTGTLNLTASFNAVSPGAVSPSVTIINASPIGSLLNAGYWTITADAEPTAGSYAASLYMTGYTNPPLANGAVTPSEQIGLVKRDGGTWIGCGVTKKGQPNQGTGSATDNGSIAGGTAFVTRSGMTSFSDFAIGMEDSNQFPLPVQLVYFTAEKSGNNADLRWSTASEINNAYFNMQRSMDGQTFEDIGQVAGHGNSDVVINYGYTDQNIPALGVPVVYYRLKQVDVDGHYQYSPMASVNISSSSQSIHVTSMYPNPVTDHMTVSYTSSARQAVRISVCDVQGKIVGEETQTNAEGGMNVYEVPGVSSLVPGFYMLHVNTGTESYQFKVVKGE